MKQYQNIWNVNLIVFYAEAKTCYVWYYYIYVLVSIINKLMYFITFVEKEANMEIVNYSIVELVCQNMHFANRNK